MTENSFSGPERREQRPDYCYQDHLSLSRRVGDIETKCDVIRAEFMGVKDQVFNMQSMMVTVGKNTSEMTTVAKVLESRMAGIENMMSIIHKYESAGGFAETAKRIGAVLAVIVQIGTLGGMVWALLMLAKRIP